MIALGTDRLKDARSAPLRGDRRSLSSLTRSEPSAPLAFKRLRAKASATFGGFSLLRLVVQPATASEVVLAGVVTTSTLSRSR